MSWLDTVERYIAPRWHLRRMQARFGADVLKRHYEAASVGRRTSGWNRSAGDGATVTLGAIGPVRAAARDLVRNNGYASSALDIITDHTIGSGVSPTFEIEQWERWAGTTACDADGMHNLKGLMKLALRTVAESGEVIIRRRIRRVDDGLEIPLQLQVLEPDFIDDDFHESFTSPGLSRTVQGVEFDAIGRRVAYWIYPEHPGAPYGARSIQSRRVPAESVIHVFDAKRSGQVRGMSWFAPLILRFRDFDDYEDATLIKQKVAACLAVVTSDINGDAKPLGTGDDGDPVDALQPGMIMNVAPGRDVSVINPPQNTDYQSFAPAQLRAIASGLGLTYEDLANDYQRLPYSAARMSRLAHWKRVLSWRDDIVTAKLLNPIWEWFREFAGIMGLDVPESTNWNYPPMEMLEPDKEGLATMRNVRTGIVSFKEVVQQRGKNWESHIDEIEKTFAELRKRGIILDIDPLFMTQAGQRQSTTTVEDPEPEPAPAAVVPTEDDEPEDDD